MPFKRAKYAIPFVLTHCYFNAAAYFSVTKTEWLFILLAIGGNVRTGIGKYRNRTGG